MALSSFIPSEVMGAYVLNALQKTLVAADVTSNRYQSEFARAGDSYKIPTLDELDVSDYTRNSTINYSGITATSQILSIDQEKYIAKHIDAVDSKEAAVNVAQNVAQMISYALANSFDKYLIQTVMSGNAAVVGGTGARALGTAGSAVSVYSSVTASGAIDYLGRLAQRLDENNVPQNDRFVICPPWFSSVLVKEKVLQTYATEAEQAFTNGRVGRAMGFDIRTSTNVGKYNTSESNIFAGHRDALEWAALMVDFKVIPSLETMFGEGIRGLYVYGGKVVRSNAIAAGWVTQS